MSDEGISWAAALDAAFHLYAGAIEPLERVALQLEPTRVFVSRFVRTLETLGHIDVARDPIDLVPSSWSSAPTTLAELADGSWLLAGWRSARLCEVVARVADAHGVSVDVQDGAGPPRLTLSGCGTTGARAIATDVAVESCWEISVAEAAAAAIASTLPPMSDVARHLPRGRVPTVGRVRQWDAKTAHWVDVRSADRPGAFQVIGYATRYFVRMEADLVEGTGGAADARVARYAGALEAGVPLVAFDETSGALVVPLGADLPGLYGRAAALASGWPPQRDRSRGALVYRDVPTLVAHSLMRMAST